MPTMKRSIWSSIGMFQDVKLYHSILMPKGHAVCIPQIGIILPDQSNLEQQNLSLLRHEFGHILQYREMGFWKFYLKVGIPSLWSAFSSRWTGHLHQNHRVERDANRRSYAYFEKPGDWPDHRFPLA